MGSRPPRVVAIGDGIVDLVTPPMEDFAPGDVQAEVPRFDPLPGGNATNFALQMSSWAPRRPSSGPWDRIRTRSSCATGIGSTESARVSVSIQADPPGARWP